MEAAWKLKIPIDRNGNSLNFELKELGIDEYMAVKTLIQKDKYREAFILFLGATRVDGDTVESLKAEFDKNNLIPFMACMDKVTEYLAPVAGELKKS